MEIKKGSRWVCIKDVSMYGGDDEIAYIKGNVYTSEKDRCITDEFEDKDHIWWDDGEEKYFIPYSKLDRVYTKYTEKLEKLFDAYDGKKKVHTMGVIQFFDNCQTDFSTGVFYASDAFEDYYTENNFTYLSEQAFIEFMDLGKYIGSLNVEIGEALEESNDFKEITDSIAELLQYKNDKYGNSALEPLEIFGGKCKVGSRLDDKLARIKNSESLKKNDVADLIGYCVLICKENNWKDFSEFMD